MKNVVLKVFMVIVACLFSMQQSWAADGKQRIYNL